MSEIEPPAPVWQTVNERGEVTGTWRESQSKAERIPGYAAEYYPDDRLRVTRFTATTVWADEQDPRPTHRPEPVKGGAGEASDG